MHGAFRLHLKYIRDLITISVERIGVRTQPAVNLCLSLYFEYIRREIQKYCHEDAYHQFHFIPHLYPMAAAS